MSRSVFAPAVVFIAAALLASCSSAPEAANKPREDSSARVQRMAEQARENERERIAEMSSQKRREEHLERQSRIRANP